MASARRARYIYTVDQATVAHCYLTERGAENMTARILFCGVIIMALIASESPSNATQRLYLASTEAKTIVTFALDEITGKLSKQSEIALPGNPGPLAFSPDGQFVYAAMTGFADNKPAVATLRRQPDGSLKLLKAAMILHRAPYIRVDRSGNFLLAAHYGPGEVTVYRIVAGICSDELLDQHITEKTAHCIEVDPSGQFVFVPHTAPNKVYQYKLDSATGKLIPNDPPFVAGPDTTHKYHEPRHYAHHPTLAMGYTSNENGGGITAWKFHASKGTLTRGQTVSTLPPDIEQDSYAADIQITPNGRFAYVSNRDATQRDDDSKPQDTICAVAIDLATGQMKIVGHYRTGSFPRATCIDLSGQFFFAAGQNSADLQAYRIDQQSGELEHLATYTTGGSPIWVMCGPVAE